MSDNNLSLPQKIIHLQKAIDDATRRKILWASFQGELFEKCFHQSKKVYKETLEETKFYKMVGAIFTKVTQTHSQLQQMSILHCSFKGLFT